MHPRTLGLALAGVASIAVAAPARADPAVAAVADTPARPSGIAVGVEVGEPAAVTVRWVGLDGLLGVGAAIGTGTRAGPGLALHGDVSLTPLVAFRRGATAVLVHVGLGARWYRHGYQSMSIDELPDTHAGVRVPIGIGAALASPRLELYLEAALGYDAWRTASCSLASGVNSLCPHASSSRAYVDVVLGARWFVGG
ncbi:MAG: hypothetical protein H6708_10170 [Kofleriaceae bacterium]|nr:hypothetical protein [Kofleriaceae bacterium]